MVCVWVCVFFSALLYSASSCNSVPLQRHGKTGRRAWEFALRTDELLSQTAGFWPSI